MASFVFQPGEIQAANEDAPQDVDDFVMKLEVFDVRVEAKLTAERGRNRLGIDRRSEEKTSDGDCRSGWMEVARTATHGVKGKRLSLGAARPLTLAGLAVRRSMCGRSVAIAIRR